MRVILLLLCFLTFSLPAQKEMTAEDAIRIGLKNNYDIQIARNDADIAVNNKGLGNAGFLPTLDLLGNYQYTSTDVETNSPFSFGNSTVNSYQGQISLNWTLFDGMQMFVGKRRFNKLAELGEAQSRNIIENAVVGILQAYFNLVQQEELLDVAKSTLEISKTRLNKEKVRRDVGGASSTDLLNAQVSYNNDLSAHLNQELRLVIALKDLNLVLAQDPETEIRVKNEITVPPLNLSFEELLKLAQKQNSFLGVSEKSRDIAKEDVKLARAPFFPRLLFNASYGHSDRTTASKSSQFSEDITSQSQDALMGLTLSWNLFNGFRNKIELQNASVEAKNQELIFRDIQNQLSGLVMEKHETFQKRLELLNLEQENVKAAEQNLQLQADRYQIGTATSLEFRDAQVNLARAQVQFVVARYQARISRLEIEQLIGNIMIQ
jgi:outer membrane protein TolC